jgi:hypothetical protein
VRMNLQKLALVVLMAGISATGCAVSVAAGCGAGLTDCGGYCADLSSDETDCGACGDPCAIGFFCDVGQCVSGTCFADSSACGHDSDCCSDYCASDGLCGCIPSGNSGCVSASDCCSGHCARDGVCDP